MLTHRAMPVAGTILAASFLYGAGCTGTVGDGSPVAALGAGSSGGTASPGAPGSPGSPGPAGTPTGPRPLARLHKLTASQFANSVHDLLGKDAPILPVEPDTPVDGFAAVGASSVAISPAGVGLYEAAIGAATDYVFADPTRAAGVLSCVPQSTADTACATKALAAFGRRAFRRPLSDAEVSRFVDVATTIGNEAGSSVLTGLRHAVWAILQSPSFLYRVELGAPSASDGGRLKYTSFEMASRLASMMWNTVPDDAVLDVAVQDQLSTPDGVLAQAKRMMADPKAHQGLLPFVDDLYGLQNIDTTSKDPTMFPGWTPSLRDAMHRELELRVDDMVFATQGDFLSLFDSRTTFVNNELALYYGLPAAAMDGFRRVDFPASSPRAGILGAGAILAGYALPQRTSPTARGKFVAESFLCETIPPPPPGVPPLPPNTDPHATLRQRLTAHRANPVCASCHARMDPLGFGMENFDTVASYRQTENGQQVDATGVLEGAPFSNLAELGSVLRKTDVVGPCFVSKVYAYAQGRSPVDWDGAALDALAAQFAAGGNRADQLLLNVVTSEAYRFVEPSKQ